MHNRKHGLKQSKHRVFKKQMDKVLADIEDLKDSNRRQKYNGKTAH